MPYFAFVDTNAVLVRQIDEAFCYLPEGGNGIKFLEICLQIEKTVI